MALSDRPVERVLALYAIIVIGVAVVRAADHAVLLWIALGHGLLLLLLAMLHHAKPTRFIEHVRDIAPIVLLIGLYGALDALNGFGTRFTSDPIVQQWEQALFGMQPSRDWWQLAPSQLWSTIFHAAYFGYYLIVPFPIVLFTLQRKMLMRRQAVLTIVTTFLLCYVCFMFVPVAGPYYEFERPASWFISNGPARLVYGLLEQASSFGAAFPSSHVAGTWVAVGATARGAPRIGAALVAPAILLTVGVVYCQMHYALDALAGLAAAALAWGVASALGRHRPGD